MPNLPSFNSSTTSIDLFLGNAADGVRECLAAGCGTECIEEFVIIALLDLDELICTACGIRVPAVNAVDLPALVSLDGEETAGEDGVPGHVAGVGVCRVAAPEDDTVGTVLDLPERAARDTDILDCDQGRAVADGCTVVDNTADLLGNLVADAHCLAAGGCPAVHQGLSRLDQHVCGPVNRLIVGDLLVGAVSLAHPGARDPAGEAGVVELLGTDCAGIRTRRIVLLSSDTVTLRSSHSVPQNGQITSVTSFGIATSLP